MLWIILAIVLAGVLCLLIVVAGAYLEERPNDNGHGEDDKP